MADGFTLKIDDDLARDLERRAQAAGLSREELALQLLQQNAINYDDYEWIGDDPRTAIIGVHEGASRPLSEARVEILAHLEDCLRKKS